MFGCSAATAECGQLRVVLWRTKWADLLAMRHRIPGLRADLSGVWEFRVWDVLGVEEFS